MSEKGDRRRVWALTLVLLAGCAQAEEVLDDTFKGDVDGQYSYNKSEYVSRRLTLAADVAYLMPQRELDGELRFDREYIKEADSPQSINRDRYDANVKFKQFFDGSPYYAYVSPRVRHNRFGYYQSAQALRAGVGRKFGGDGSWTASAEMGSGYRVAHAEDGDNVSEVLYTTSVKANWDITDQLSIKFNGVQEQSRRETFRTMGLALRNKLTNHIALKYEVLYRRSFPFDSKEKDGELSAEFGVGYSF
ncbi:MAG TPA: DUF481 domain-containing protein [Aquabacterium sp.]|uniref:DUF481 domain-containing protein n=1 Tax=Aquabacterium sp. TaxID=1872578 RepID=UPI002E32288F|nr:DUF481 domain-containing protein [Aquabacterium sp.]HEX5357596.1 DUF481 domain-containing protein [Aquabacterium sp.]